MGHGLDSRPSTESDFRSVTYEDLGSIIHRLSFSSDRELFSPVISPEPTRRRRQTRVPISYKEPSLNSKVRKGHQFFKYTESQK
jgi:hypothetical protein